MRQWHLRARAGRKDLQLLSSSGSHSIHLGLKREIEMIHFFLGLAEGLLGLHTSELCLSRRRSKKSYGHRMFLYHRVCERIPPWSHRIEIRIGIL